jgi:hypothetical protein
MRLFLFNCSVNNLICIFLASSIGLINEIMSKGRRMTYVELCNAVLPVWLLYLINRLLFSACLFRGALILSKTKQISFIHCDSICSTGIT